MKLNKNFTVKEIAELINCSFVGDRNHIVSGLNEIHKVESGDLMFVDHPKYYDKALNSKATTILIDKEVECPKGKALIVSENPFDDYNKLAKHFSPFVSQTSLVGENTLIDSSAVIFPNVFVGHNCSIGANVILHPGAVIGNNSILEENVIIGANSVIGHYAFYYKKKETGYDRMYSIGHVHLKKNVEIGALCTIDSGVSGVTEIGEGTKIDNQVHIGHDTVVGAGCLMAANVGVAGCVIIEDNVTLWGQVGLASDITLKNGCTVLAQSGVTKDVEEGKTVFGSPSGDVRMKFRELAAVKKLPEIIEKI